MIVRLSIQLSKEELEALQSAANSEIRSPREQARFIIREELQRRGLMQKPKETLSPLSRKDPPKDD